MHDSESTIRSAEPEETSVTEVFHRLKSVIPLDQDVLSVTPDTEAVDALQLLNKTGFSQLPIVQGRQVLGLFSYRSYARAVVKHARATTANRAFDPLTLLVEDCVERTEFARVSDEFNKWFDYIDRHDAILVGDPDRLLAIVTAMDILRYLYEVASPFVLIAESELALRALIRLSVGGDELVECVKNCLSTKYESLPTSLEEMTFSDYVQIIGDGRNWTHFQPVFGGNRLLIRAKLEHLRDLRNDVFHFKREITVQDYEDLAEVRDWMLFKVRAVEARREENK